MLATITYMGFGTPFIYMGQEAGLTNCDFKNMDELKDPVSHFVYELMTGYGMPAKLAFHFIKYGARDHARVPMQWDDTVNGGFNKGHETWQCTNPLYKEINVKKDMESEKSIYRYYQKLLQIKKNNETAVYGLTKEYDHNHHRIIAYSRTYHAGKLFIIGNFSKYPCTYRMPSEYKDAELLLNNYEVLDQKNLKIHLKPYQALVLEKKYM